MFNAIWQKIKHSIPPIVDAAQNTAQHFSTIVKKTPVFFGRISSDKQLRFVVANSLWINIKEFFSPFIWYTLTKKASAAVITRAIKTEENQYQNTEMWVESFFDYAVLPVMIIRYSLKNSATHLVAQLGALSYIKFAHEEKTALIDCQNCNQPQGIDRKIALLLHYYLTTIAINFINNKLLPTPLRLLGLLLESYWEGFVLIQFSMSSKNICPEDQLRVLLANRSQLTAFGLFYRFSNYFLQHIIDNAAPYAPVPAVILKIGTANVLSLLGIVHAHEIVLEEHPLICQSPNDPPVVDPIFQSWILSVKLINLMLEALKKTLKNCEENKQNQFQYLQQMLDTVYKKIGVLPLQDLQAFFSQIFIEPELYSLNNFINYSPLKPYTFPIIHEIEHLVSQVDTGLNSPLAHGVKKVCNIPLVGTVLLFSIKKGVSILYGVPPLITGLLVKLARNENFVHQLSSAKNTLAQLNREEAYTDENSARYNCYTRFKQLAFFPPERDWELIETEVVAASVTSPITVIENEEPKGVLEPLVIQDDYFEFPNRLSKFLK